MMYWSLSFTHSGSPFSACKIWGKWPNKLFYSWDFQSKLQMSECLHPIQFNEDWESNPLSDYENFRREGGYSSSQALCAEAAWHMGAPPVPPDFTFLSHCKVDNALGHPLWGQEGFVGMKTPQTVKFWTAQRQGSVPNTWKDHISELFPCTDTAVLAFHKCQHDGACIVWYKKPSTSLSNGDENNDSGRNEDKQKKLFGVRDHPLKWLEKKR